MGICKKKKEKQPTSNNRKTEISHFFVTVGCHANLISCEYGKVANYYTERHFVSLLFSRMGPKAVHANFQFLQYEVYIR